MKITVDIPDKVLAEAMRHTRAKTKREAIVTAIADGGPVSAPVPVISS